MGDRRAGVALKRLSVSTAAWSSRHRRNSVALLAAWRNGSSTASWRTRDDVGGESSFLAHIAQMRYNGGTVGGSPKQPSDARNTR